jgi:hypothetical protein
MAELSEKRPYEQIRDILESIGGKMIYRPGGGPGGVWVLDLWGRTIKVEVRDNRVNCLDQLYIAKVKNPKTWEDYDPEAQLVEDVRWKLVALFSSSCDFKH